MLKKHIDKAITVLNRFMIFLSYTILCPKIIYKHLEEIGFHFVTFIVRFYHFNCLCHYSCVRGAFTLKS